MWGARGHNSSGLALTVMLLSRQLFVLLLDQDGIRAKSWADANDRQVGEEGIFWRSGNHTWRLIGYDEDDRPLLLGFGSTTASKQRGPAGNSRPGHCAFGSRSAQSAADDINLTLALLAIFSKAYDESFARALLDPAYGKELLRGMAYKEWEAVDAAKNSPVLVEYFYRRKSSRAVLKHAKDKLAPGLADIDNLCPLGNPPRNWLMGVGKAAGLQCDLGTAHLRRSHAIKERLHGKTSVPEMVELCHRAGQDHLHQDVYTAEMDPETHAKMANAVDHSEPVRSALQGVHAVPGRPTLADVDGDILNNLVEKVDALLEASTAGQQVEDAASSPSRRSATEFNDSP